MRFVVMVLCVAAAVHGETGRDAWLRYEPLASPPALPAVIVVDGDSAILRTARDEIIRGVRAMTGKTLRVETGEPKEPAIMLSAFDVPHEDGYELVSVHGRNIVITGTSDRGVLYGAFALLRRIALGGQPLNDLDLSESGYAQIRWVNEWDNLDGSIERGYGGRSIFFENGHVRQDLSRVSEYGRLLASVGINGCAINSVNADPRILAPDFLPGLARIAEAFRPWGVRVVLSVDFGSPKAIGGLDTFDPLDPKVAAWWKHEADEVYRAIPDLAGFLIKADSEGRVGPSAYGRTHADAANVVARALKPHGGLIFYRGFVYNHHMDWRNLKNDRARAAYDNFHDLDGAFDDNVVLQIKNGPIDFQVREPASPLIGALQKTNQALELQITQEYMGQARHTVFLAPMWKDTLDFDLQARGPGTPVKALVAGKTFHRPVGGFVGVSNVGLDDSWYGNQLSQANLYAFGRLAWNPDLSSRQINDEWTRLTFGSDPEVLRTVSDIQLTSWRTYENYTGPLGLQTLTDITGNHYGVAVEASERNGWGQWHRADEMGVGMDRTVATGTGYIGQYRPAVAKIFESPATCPDDLLLFFHHVTYTYKLHDGKTVIQYVYDSHYEGAEAVERYVREWKTLRGRIDGERYREVLAQLKYQAGQAEVWRDAVTNWFRRESGIPDDKGRVGHYPGRVEAEAMQLGGYVVREVTPWEGASGGKAVECEAQACTASTEFHGAPGWYTIRVEYFDQNNGAANFRVHLNQQSIDEWAASNKIPTKKVDASSSTRRSITGVALRPGDTIRIEGTPDRGDVAAIDYIEIVPFQ